MLDCDWWIDGCIVLLFDQSLKSSSRLSSIRRACSCSFSTTPPGHQSFLSRSDCGLQTSGEDELSQPHQGHFSRTGGTQRPLYVTCPASLSPQPLNLTISFTVAYYYLLCNKLKLHIVHLNNLTLGSLS